MYIIYISNLSQYYTLVDIDILFKIRNITDFKKMSP